MARISQPSRTSRRLIAALALTGALVSASQATAIPVNGGGLPLNEPPTAALGGTPNPVVVPTPIAVFPGAGTVATTALQLGAPVAFSAIRSSDDDGSIVKYEWDLDGAAGFERTTTSATATQRYSSPATITARVRVTDDDGATDIATLPLKAHRAPVVRIATSKAVAVVGEGVTFNSSTSTDDEGIALREWDLDGDGTFERTADQVTTSFGTTGPHAVSLRLTDTLGAKSAATVTVRVHRAPTALIITAPPVPVVDQPTTLDGSRSSDDGSIATYEWDLNGDGTFETSTAALPTATTTFTAVGPAKVGLKVTDNDGSTDQTSLTVQVSATPVATIDSSAPRLRPLAKNLRISTKGRIALRVACPATEQICTVGVQVRGLKGALAGRSLGRARAGLQGGRTATISVPLSSAARRALGRGALRARVVLTVRDATGSVGITRTAVTIRR